MDWSKYAALSAEWTEKTLAYAGGINAFAARGIAEGWDDVGEALFIVEDITSSPLASFGPSASRESGAS